MQAQYPEGVLATHIVALGETVCYATVVQMASAGGGLGTPLLYAGRSRKFS